MTRRAGVIGHPLGHSISPALYKAAFEAAGSSPFTYDRKGHEAVALSYWRAPEEDMDDADALCAWAVKGWEAARRAAIRKPKPRKPRRPA